MNLNLKSKNEGGASGRVCEQLGGEDEEDRDGDGGGRQGGERGERQRHRLGCDAENGYSEDRLADRSVIKMLG